MSNKFKEVGVGIEAVAEKIAELVRKRTDALEIERNARCEVTELTTEIIKLRSMLIRLKSLKSH